MSKILSISEFIDAIRSAAAKDRYMFTLLQNMLMTGVQGHISEDCFLGMLDILLKDEPPYFSGGSSFGPEIMIEKFRHLLQAMNVEIEIGEEQRKQRILHVYNHLKKTQSDSDLLSFFKTQVLSIVLSVSEPEVEDALSALQILFTKSSLADMHVTLQQVAQKFAVLHGCLVSSIQEDSSEDKPSYIGIRSLKKDPGVGAIFAQYDPEGSL